jgi:hypothetical protein
MVHEIENGDVHNIHAITTAPGSVAVVHAIKSCHCMIVQEKQT